MSNNHLLEAAMHVVHATEKHSETLPGDLANIVKTHSALAVGCALIPVPGADMAAAIANVVAMYGRINKELDIPFGENMLKTIAAAVVTDIAKSAAVLLVGASMVKFLPGVGTLMGAAIMGTFIYGITYASGIVYMNALAMFAGKEIHHVTEAELKRKVQQAMADKERLNEMLKQGKAAHQGG